MSILPIRQYPDPVLRDVCEPVEKIDAELERFAEDLLDTMYDAPGRGLAAPQVGKLIRMFVFDVTWKDGPRSPTICINPEITPIGKETRSVEETCLSIPDRPVMVTRPAKVRMRWQDLFGDWQEMIFTGDDAVIVQHENDHLDGHLCIDYEATP